MLRLCQPAAGDSKIWVLLLSNPKRRADPVRVGDGVADVAAVVVDEMPTVGVDHRAQPPANAGASCLAYGGGRKVGGSFYLAKRERTSTAHCS